MPGFQSTRLVTEGALEPFFFLYTDDSIQGNPETCKQSSVMLNYEVKNSQAILCGIKFKVIHILKAFGEFLYIPDSKTFQIVDNSHKYLKSRLLFSGIHDCYPPSK